MKNTINRKSCIGVSIQNNIGLRNCCSKSFSLKPIPLKMSTHIRQSAQSYKGFIYGKLSVLTATITIGSKKGGSGWEIQFYARACFQADKKQAYKQKYPCFPRKNLKSGALDSNFALSNKVEKVESVMPWVASVKTLAARPSSKREVHTKIPNSRLQITNYKLHAKQKAGNSTNKKLSDAV